MDRDSFTSLRLRASLAHNVVGVIEVGFEVLEHGIKVLKFGFKVLQQKKRRNRFTDEISPPAQLTERLERDLHRLRENISEILASGFFESAESLEEKELRSIARDSANAADKLLLILSNISKTGPAMYKEITKKLNGICYQIK